MGIYLESWCEDWGFVMCFLNFRGVWEVLVKVFGGGIREGGVWSVYVFWSVVNERERGREIYGKRETSRYRGLEREVIIFFGGFFSFFGSSVVRFR